MALPWDKGTAAVIRALRQRADAHAHHMSGPELRTLADRLEQMQDAISRQNRSIESNAMP